MDFYKETNKKYICENLSGKQLEVLKRIDRLFIINDVSKNGKYIYIKFNRDTHYCEEYELINLVLKKSQRKRRMQLENKVVHFKPWNEHEEEFLVFYIDQDGYKVCKYIPKHIDGYIIENMSVNDNDQMELDLYRFHYERTKRIRKEIRHCSFNIQDTCCFNISALHTDGIEFINL